MTSFVRKNEEEFFEFLVDFNKYAEIKLTILLFTWRIN